jgi:hypothetical protein
MKAIARTIVAVSIGLAAGTALAETETFPASPNEAPAFSVTGPTRADRYATEAAPAGRQDGELAAPKHRTSRFPPAWWRGGSPAQQPLGYPQEADG